MFKGFVKLINGDIEEFAFEAEKYKSYLNSLKPEVYDCINLGNVHALKSKVAYVKFTEVPSNKENNE